MKIYTRTGDAGETSLFDGSRVRKSDPRVAAYGDVDELAALLGLARAGEGLDAADRDLIAHLQRDLFAVGARLADPAHKIAGRVDKATIGPEDVSRLEAWIDRFDGALPPLRHFILAGGCPAGAVLHLARTVCRRAERRMVALDPPADPILLTYVNRLSDLLFMFARAVNHRAGVEELAW